MKNNKSGRDYKKEAKRYNELYARFYLSLNQSYGEKLRAILNKEEITYTQFVKNLIDSYYKEDKDKAEQE